MATQHAPETLKRMGKNELIQLIINTSEENQIDWSSYGSLTRKKQADLVEIASEVLHAASKLGIDPVLESIDISAAYDSEEEFLTESSNGDVLGKEEDWEYAEPNKPRWMQETSEETAIEDVEVNPDIDLEEFDDVAEVVAAVIAKPPKKVKVAKEPKAKKEKAPKEPKGPRQRTFTAEQINEMIQLVEEAKWKKSKVAEKFECSSTFIHNVIVGNVYRDITGRGQAKKTE